MVFGLLSEFFFVFLEITLIKSLTKFVCIDLLSHSISVTSESFTSINKILGKKIKLKSVGSAEPLNQAPVPEDGSDLKGYISGIHQIKVDCNLFMQDRHDRNA